MPLFVDSKGYLGVEERKDLTYSHDRMGMNKISRENSSFPTIGLASELLYSYCLSVTFVFGFLHDHFFLLTSHWEDGLLG